MLDLLYQRRSIRKYLDIPVSKEHRRQLIEAALLAPSSHGNQPWEFIVVDDKDKLLKLSEAKAGAQPLRHAPLGIVVVADPAKSDVWIEDAAIAMTQMWLTAVSLGLGGCWIQIRNRQYTKDTSMSAEDYVCDILGIPVGRHVEAILACGYPDESRPAHRQEELKTERVFQNQYGNHDVFTS